MATYTLKTRQTAPELRRIVMAAVAIMYGRGPDPGRAGYGIKLRIAAAFFAKVKAAFVVKSRGGTDDAGIAWPWLSVKYLAYGRRGIIKKLTKPEKKIAPINYESLARYKTIYRENFARLNAANPGGDAKGIAKRIALTIAKRETGGNTKLATARTLIPGADYEILRDTGVLLNSLSPGVVTGGATPSYTAKPNQVLKAQPGELIVGTNVAYAGVHHYGSRTKNIPARPLWPEGQQMPQAWLASFADAGRRGLEVLILSLLKKAG